MGQRSFFDLLRWELSAYLSLPVFVFLLASAIIAVLAVPLNILGDNYVSLYNGSGMIFVILPLVTSALFSRSFAGGLGHGEVKLMLSYPVKRWQLFLSKFLAMFLPIFGLYGGVYCLHLYLDSLSVFEPMFYLSLFAFLLQLMFACAISVAVSIVTQSEVIAILAAVLLLFGIDSLGGDGSYLSGHGRFRFLFQYFGGLTHGSLPFDPDFVVTSSDVAVAILVPVLVFAVLIAVSFVYFARRLEVD
jgi:ABC-type transport system involved in multi-copper enzyme maturation permease subunit